MKNNKLDADDFILIGLEGVSLTEEERELLGNDAAILSGIWHESKEVTLLRYFKAIMMAQINKAMNGDTASAKFLTDFVSPGETPDNAANEPVLWERLAIQLRDSMQLECSAEELVVNVLTSMLSMPADVRALILPTPP